MNWRRKISSTTHNNYSSRARSIATTSTTRKSTTTRKHSPTQRLRRTAGGGPPGRVALLPHRVVLRGRGDQQEVLHGDRGLLILMGLYADHCARSFLWNSVTFFLIWAFQTCISADWMPSSSKISTTTKRGALRIWLRLSSRAGLRSGWGKRYFRRLRGR